MRDLSTIIKTCGKTTVVLTTYRNANATAFASIIIIEDVWGVRFEADAKSQGPSAGGYSKPDQALSRLVGKLRLPEDWYSGYSETVRGAERLAHAVADMAEQHRKAGTKAPWLATVSQ